MTVYGDECGVTAELNVNFSDSPQHDDNLADPCKRIFGTPCCSCLSRGQSCYLACIL
jgi:hypothetical protein